MSLPASLLTGAVFVGALVGCEDASKPKPRARQPEQVVVRDVPSVLRDTLAAQATLSGTEPTLVSGYGLVVGLNGTGGGDFPGPVRGVMEREMLLMGVGREDGVFRDVTPNELLADRNTAVVLVTAVIPAGAPAGTRFDVRVDALPGTSTSSLEGGRLYTTRLYEGLVRPAAPVTESVAEASGALFLNPYADPALAGEQSVYRTVGRVLNGGVVTDPAVIMLALDAPSHSRVRAVAEAINTRFPQARAEPPTAKGMNEEAIEINIPPQFRRDPVEFFQILSRVRVDQSFPEEAARRYVEALKEQPELAEELARCLRALGPKSIPFLRELYGYAELRPRMAAVEAGAKLGDLTVQRALEELAQDGPPGIRTRAIRLMGELGVDPEINLFVRERLDSDDVDMRIVAYETLEKRADPLVERTKMGEKFVVDVVPSSLPMVYVTLQREPKIVLFGGDIELRQPVFASIWEDRLMVSAEETDPGMRVFYRDYRGGESSIGQIRPSMMELLRFLSHRTTPEEPAPGLDLSYAEVVGALSGLLRKGIAPAQFVPESDKLQLELVRLRQTESGEERPEFEGDLPDDSPGAASQGGLDAPGEATSGDRPEGEATPPTGDSPSAGESADPRPAGPPAKRRYTVPLQPPASPDGKKPVGKKPTSQ